VGRRLAAPECGVREQDKREVTRINYGPCINESSLLDKNLLSFFLKKVLDGLSFFYQDSFVHHAVHVVLITPTFSETMVSGIGLYERQPYYTVFYKAPRAR
jgi:hypothetical protein